ncbi:cytochrome P450 714C2-like [Corylus avellana]|uniref:cytochrome P450 714C2-like n=1 Tax=Corylus avellana TaxID=13451 RepID=UPI00286B8703|nr:cytochrome P450 714C2-like [Corylus avellana]XP_059463200.1 cytochrome P450 714C2-like [Corylus avellana]
MELLLLLVKIIITIALLWLVSTLLQMCDAQILKPRRLRSILRKQGIRGPPPSFFLGNIGDMKKMKSSASKDQQKEEQAITHDCSSALFPFFDEWRKSYGSLFMFSLGNKQILHMNDPEVVKEISICTSLDFGKPSYQSKERGPLLGQGILTSNGATWAHQRKILAPQLYMNKVKGMMDLMVESSMKVVSSWRTESEGGVEDFHIDEYMRRFSGDVISRACFGSNYSKGKEIFLKLRELQENMSKKFFSNGFPGMRYVPTKSNRETWRLEKEVRDLILKAVEEGKEAASGNDLLHMILEAASNSGFSQDETDRFIVDNSKNIYLAGYETTAVSATWTLMLLASNQEWQARVRAEVVEVCGGQMPDADMIRKMKTLTMVIHESLRLYPPVPVVSREALEDMKFGDIHVPKGVNVWILLVTLHQDLDIWGPDAKEFNPERFANGASGACKLPHVYMPFGVGQRTCLGQNFAMAELKILLALIVSNFSFSLSPKYRHSPAMRTVIEPENGVNLLIKKL